MVAADRAKEDGMLRKAYSLHQAGRLAEAARAYGEILSADPKQFDALFLLGLVQLQSGEFQKAERVLGEAIALNPKAEDAIFARAAALQELGRHADALAALDSLLALKPDHPVAWNNRGNTLLALDRGSEAMASYGRAIALKPDYAEAWHNRAVARMMAQVYGDAEADLNRALSLKPAYPDALEHLGVTLAAQDRHVEAIESYDAALKLRAQNGQLLCRRADSLLHLDRLLAATADYDRSLELAPDNPDAWHNRGVTLSRLGHHLEALESYDKALALKPEFAGAWHNRGSAQLALKNHAEALSSYDRALALQPDNAQVWNSRGVLLTSLQHYAESLAAFDRALSIRRDDAGAWQGRGNALSRLERQEEALASYDEALRLRPGDTDSLYNRANVLLLLKRFEEAARDCEALLAAVPDYPYALGLLLHARFYVCDWRGFDEACTNISAALGEGKRVVHPFLHLAISQSPHEQLRCAAIWAGDHNPAAPASLWRGESYGHEKIRVAYLSADFHAHATAFLMAGVFEEHDRSRFETYAISFAPNDESDMRGRLERAFDRFIDVRGISDSAVAAMLREMEIDIAVDLKGYTGGARPGILAYRPAPVQLHYLGYPGTMGAASIDYLIADHVIVPQAQREFFAEQIAYLPDCYQCNDSRRRMAERVPSREELGLPERGFVFCCFNSNYKIGPKMFDIWMGLLAAVEGSVLWLFEEDTHAVANLRREAQRRELAPERLVFAKRLALEDHLARLTQADLVLDTMPYGAHTTASDALWVGVPVLTCLGTTFAGRVAASLLTALGLPELIAHSLDEYRMRALELARDPSGLTAMKAKLAKNRDASTLFDTALVTRHLEAAYTQMWERRQRGEAPISFAVERAATPVSR